MIHSFAVKSKFLVPLLSICVSMMLFNTDDFNNLPAYGHLFTSNETATFVGIVDQVQAELESVVTNLENNNVSLAQSHAIKAASLLTPKIMFEITEDNPGLTSDLQKSCESAPKHVITFRKSTKKCKSVVNDLNKRLDQDAIVRIAQLQPTSSNFLEGALKSLGSIFGGSNIDENEIRIQTSGLSFCQCNRWDANRLWKGIPCWI